MTQTIFDRCLIIFAFLILILAILTGCTPESAVSSSTSLSSPTDTLTSREQYDTPLVSNPNFHSELVARGAKG